MNLHPPLHPPTAALRLPHDCGRGAGQDGGGELARPRKPRRTWRGATSSGTLLSKVLPEAKNTLVLVELILQLVRAAIFVLKMAVCHCRLASRPAPQGARQLPGPFACARCTAQTACCRRFCHGVIEFLRLPPWVFVVVCRVPAWPARVGICVRSDIPWTMYGDGGHVGTLRTRPDGRKRVDGPRLYGRASLVPSPQPLNQFLEPGRLDSGLLGDRV